MPDKIDERRCSGTAAIVLIVACLGLTALGAAWGCSAPPVADAQTLLSTRCSTCHSPQRGQTTKKTRAEWEQTVTRMIGKGAKINTAERAVLVDHLAKITAL